MKRQYKDKLDRFYTKKEIVEKILAEINISDYKLIIEPSAGNGAFSLRMPCLAFDISPMHDSIIQQDFLQWSYSGDINRKDILCLGNPPYGVKCSIAIKFIKHCANFADHIGFILPLSFKKTSIQNRIPLNYHLTQEIELPKYSFLLEGSSFDVPSVFQMWENKNEKRIKPKKIKPIGFSYVKSEEADFSIRRIGRRAGDGYYETNKSPISHYFIKTEYNKDQIIEKLNAYPWPHNNTVGPKSIPQSELNEVLNKILLECDKVK